MEKLPLYRSSRQHGTDCCRFTFQHNTLCDERDIARAVTSSGVYSIESVGQGPGGKEFIADDTAVDFGEIVCFCNSSSRTSSRVRDSTCFIRKSVSAIPQKYAGNRTMGSQ